MPCALPIQVAVYSGRDNTVALAIRGDDGLVMPSLAAVTRVTLSIGGTLVDSEVVGSSVIWWTDRASYRGQSIDVVRFSLGDTGIAVGVYPDCVLVLYSADKPDGVRIETPIKVEVKA